ncbi:hypothetical protein BDK51DRAFT_32484, partial [Blyttiomyces helicus]
LELEDKELQYLYADEDSLHCMDPETFEESSFPVALLAGGKKLVPYLHAGIKVSARFNDTEPVAVRVPERSTYTVAETAPPPSSGGSADSKTTPFKPATLDVGAIIGVPEFIKVGDRIVVSIEEEKYIAKAKE